MNLNFYKMFLKCLFVSAIIIIMIILLAPPCYTEEIKLCYLAGVNFFASVNI